MTVSAASSVRISRWFAAATTRERAFKVERGPLQRRGVDQLDREAALGHLISCAAAKSTERDGFREHTTTSVRPAARWQYVSACAPITRTRSVSGA